MAADSSMGFTQGMTSAFYNHHMLSFQNGGVYGGGGAGMVPGGVYSSMGSGSNARLFLSPDNVGLASTMPANSASTSSSGGSTQNYKFVTGSPADWTLAELAILKEGLIRYAHEPNIMKYIKIAAMLPARTIRDVALRCWWNTSRESTKRRKHEVLSPAKRIRDVKDKMVVPSSEVNFNMVAPNNLTPFSLSMYHPNRDGHLSNEVDIIDNATKSLLEENSQLLSQIAANIDTLKLHENMDLLFQSENNIKTILNRMSETPGIMCRMPPLPVAVNDGYLSSILQFNNMLASYGSVISSCAYTKQESSS